MKVGTDHPLRPDACTDCGYKIDGATCVGSDAAPKRGDATICQRCGHIMIFGKGLKLRNPTGDEILELAGNEKILAIQRARAMLQWEPK